MTKVNFQWQQTFDTIYITIKLTETKENCISCHSERIEKSRSNEVCAQCYDLE